MHQTVKLKHASDTSVFFQALAGFAIAALVMIGVGGTVYKLIEPGGWFAQLFGRSLAGGNLGGRSLTGRGLTGRGLGGRGLGHAGSARLRMPRPKSRRRWRSGGYR